MKPNATFWVGLGALMITAGTVFATWVVPDGPVTTGELDVSYLLSNLRNPPVTAVAVAIHYIFGPVIMPLLFAGIAIGALAARRWQIALMAVWFPVIGWGFSRYIKSFWDRPRPPTVFLRTLVDETSASFPSGHTSIACVVVALTFALLWYHGQRLYWWYWAIAAVGVGIVALSRVYVGAHYLGDVAAAPLFTFGAIAISWPLLHRLVSPRPVDVCSSTDNGVGVEGE